MGDLLNSEDRRLPADGSLRRSSLSCRTCCGKPVGKERNNFVGFNSFRNLEAFGYMIKELKVFTNVATPIYYVFNRIIFHREHKVYKVAEDLQAVSLGSLENRSAVEQAVPGRLGVRIDDVFLIYINEKESTAVPLPASGRKQIKLIHSGGIILRHEQEGGWVIKNISFEGDTIWQIEFASPFYANKSSNDILTIYTYATPRPVIASYRLSDGSKLWQLDVKDLVFWERVEILAGQTVQYENKLFFCCQSDRERRTFCLDETNGKKLRRFDNVGSYLKQYGNKLYSVAGWSTLTELDMRNLEVRTWDLSSVLKEPALEINLSRFAVTDDGLLCFTDGYMMPRSRFGIIDINKKMLLHVEAVEDINSVDSSIGVLEVFGNMICVHTSENCLHVYELTGRQ